MIGTTLRRCLSTGIGLAIASSATARADDAASGSFGENVAPVVSQFCVQCHNAKKAKGEINLEAFADEASILKDLKTWRKVLDILEDGSMPPADQPQPGDEQSAHLLAYLQSVVSKAGCNVNADPGRVTMRRLNREEYNNTIRDLVGVDFRPAEDFPADDVGYGFDNIGDVLTLPPLLMEKYLAAAERIATLAIVADEPPTGPTRTFTGLELSKGSGHGPGSVDDQSGGWFMATNAEAVVGKAFPEAGSYRVRVRAFAEQAGDEPARMEIRVAGKKEKAFEVPAERGAPGTYEAIVRRAEPGGRLDVAFTNDAWFPNEANPARRDRNLVVVSIEVQGPLVGQGYDLPASHRRIVFREPDRTRPNEPNAATDRARPNEAIRAILQRFATRAFRRPATPAEVDRLLALVDGVMADGESFEHGLRLAIQAVLVSPHFLFRVELDDRPDAPRELSDLELASRLSYFLWSSMPDDPLLDLAVQGRLHDPEVMKGQVARMLADGKSWSLIENFSSQWLQTRALKIVSPSLGRGTRFDEPLRAAMKREPELFFEAVVREDRSILDFLDSDYTFLNERLARHYGIEGVEGPEFRRVSLTDGKRGGVVTMASVLTVTSNPTRTSPVKRGKWILEEILGTPPPPPPPGISDLPDEKKGVLTGSVRTRMEKHRADPNCATCHSRMDPLGFSLDNYNAIGAWRDNEGPFPIDASGVLPSGQTFTGPKELKGILLGKKEAFAACLTEKMMTFALGRGLDAKDHCVVEAVAESVLRDGGKFSTLIAGIVNSGPFRKRGADGSQSP
ncbi:DUF1592 domain-containing protein [Tundrisphaera sp. TA3]|uniref:DUF1592 domain-containing protein n=1 Tax=Tundrisphaera sp. TA3 TaxID=3435775 RepID=UPI003EBA8FCB